VVLDWLCRGLFRSKPPPEFVLLSRVGCHLCDDARQLLEHLRSEFEFTVRIVDVDGDADLVRQYGDKVPVILVDGRSRLWGRINPVLLRRIIKKRCPRRQPDTA